MDKVNRWELLGVPASLAFSALYELGALAPLGLTEHHIPHLMVLAYIVAAGIRTALQRRAAASSSSAGSDGNA